MSPSIYYTNISQGERLAIMRYLAEKDLLTLCDRQDVCPSCIYWDACKQVSHLARDTHIPDRPLHKTMRGVALEILRDLYEETEGYESYCYDRAISAIEDTEE